MFLRETATEERTQALGEMLYTPGGFVWDPMKYGKHTVEYLIINQRLKFKALLVKSKEGKGQERPM